MLVPLGFGILFYFYYRQERKLGNVIIGYVLFAIGVLAALGSVSVFFIDETKSLPLIVPKFIFLFLGMGLLSYLMLRIKPYRLLIFAIIMLMIRIGFNWTVIPARHQLDQGIPAKAGAIQLARMVPTQELWILRTSGVDDFAAFYITRERGKMLPKRYENFYDVDDNTYYIADNNKLFGKEYRLFYSYNTHWQNRKLKLVKLLHEDPEE